MSTKDESAFPCYVRSDCVYLGLTKREYFAGLAMQGLLASGELDPLPTIITRSIEHADALIAALEERQ